VRVDADRSCPGDIFGDRLAGLRKAGGRAVMREPLIDSLFCGGLDVKGRVKIRFADFEMDDLFSLSLEGAGLCENFKCRFRAQAAHSLCYVDHTKLQNKDEYTKWQRESQFQKRLLSCRVREES